MKENTKKNHWFSVSKDGYGVKMYEIIRETAKGVVFSENGFESKEKLENTYTKWFKKFSEAKQYALKLYEWKRKSAQETADKLTEHMKALNDDKCIIIKHVPLVNTTIPLKDIKL